MPVQPYKVVCVRRGDIAERCKLGGPRNQCRRTHSIEIGQLQIEQTHSTILAAAGLYALEHNIARLAEDHANARLLAERLADTRVQIDLATVQSNIVIFRVPEPLPDAATVVRRAQEKGVLVSAFAVRTVRAVTHLNVDAAQCRHAAEVLARAVSSD